MSGGLLCVLPIISTTYADACVESLRRPDSAAGLKPEEILVVDNSRDGFAASRYGLETYRDPDGHNLGVARSWNIGARRVLDEGLDYLLIMSASMLFGPEYQTTWRRQMESFWGHNVLEATGHSWHLIAIHRRIFEQVGLFDENFHAYEEAIDFGYRMRMLGLECGFISLWVNALSQGAGLHGPLISCPAEPLQRYYQSKWNGRKGEERWVQPFGSKPIDYWEPISIPELAERSGWETWW